MKIKTVLLTFLSLFCLFVFSDKQTSAKVVDSLSGELISDNSDLVDIILGKPILNKSYPESIYYLTDNDLDTAIRVNGTDNIVEFGQQVNVFEFHYYMSEYYLMSNAFSFRVNGEWVNYSLPTGYYGMNTSNKWVKVNVSELFSVEFITADAVRVLHNSDSPRMAELKVFAEYEDVFPPNKISNVQYVFNEDNSITYTYDFPSDSDFSHLEIYQGSSLLNEKFTNNSIKITDLVPLMNYTFKFISVDKSGNKSEPYESIITMPEGPDLIPPLEISNLKHIVYDTSVQFTYSLPIDDDFSHIQVWRGNEQIADNVRINSFKDENLDYETSYNYVFKTVDFSGNVSNGSSLTIKTMPFKDDIPPLAPVGLEVITGNSSLSFSWIPSPENDVLGYNIYVDDVKINGSVILGNSYRLTNLTNGNEYKIQVSAVDTSGNESELSNSFVAVPDESKLPVFKVDTDLKSVAESTENWFSELWLVLAFSSSIPIAFLVGHRIKNLFFA